MKIDNMIYFTKRSQWRKWLEKNHASSDGIWLVYFKKASGKPRIPYGDAVEEALCFGWIDSVIQKIDDEKYAQKFSPRHMRSIWSESNKQRVANMINAGWMTQAGLDKVTYPHPERFKRKPAAREDLRVPTWLKRALMSNKKAWANFRGLAPGYRRIYLRWLLDAKTPPTRDKRINEAVSLLEQNKKLGMK